MAKKTSFRGIAVVAVVAGLVAGCAASGTVRKVTASDASLLTGTWSGNMYSGQAPTTTATVTVRPDGTYTTQAGAFSSTGKTEIKDGYVHFMSTGGTGGLAAGDRAGSATLMDRGSSWGLVGNGYGSTGGPYNFDLSKAK
jgi:heat shock protein HslJ